MMEKRFVLWAFQAPQWAEQFEKGHQTSWTCDEMLEKIHKLEEKYIVWERMLSLGTLFGLVMIILGSVFGTIIALEGLFVALVCQMTRFESISRCAQSMCMLHILWDARKREEEALLKSEIQDL
jgi:hypothetical protein